MTRIYHLSRLLIGIYAFLLTSCMVPIPYNVSPQLMDIPLIPHTQEVELYFENQLPKNKAYYEVLGLSAEGNDYNAMLLQLKSKASRAGVDAVIYVQNSQASYASAEGGPYTIPIVKGIGIKYRDSLTYIDQYVKNKKVYNLTDLQNDTSTPPLLYEASFSMQGLEVPKGQKPNTVYNRFVRELSFDYLLYETYNWAYRTDPQGRIIERKYFTNAALPQTYMICLFTYTFTDDVKSIKISYPSYPMQNIYMELVYTADNKVSEKLIYDNASKKKKLLYIEKLAYDQLNRIAQTTLYKIEQNKQVPFLQTIYSYYTMDDLPAPKEFNLYNSARQIKEDPSTATNHLTSGSSAEQASEPQQALENTKNALQPDPGSLDANLSMGVVHYNKGADISKQLNAMDLKQYQIYGKELEAQLKAHFQDALPYFQKAYSIDQTNLAVLQPLLSIYKVLGMKEAAQKILKQIESLN